MTVVQAESTGALLHDDTGMVPQSRLAKSLYYASITDSTAPNFKVRRAHAEMHAVRANRTSQSSVTTSAETTSPLTLRAEEDELCPTHNGTIFITRDSQIYELACDIDFVGNDHPFLFVHSYDECVDACDAFNAKEKFKNCVAALFVPSRLNGKDNCYLKSAVDRPAPAHLRIEGAILIAAARPFATTSTPSTSSTPTSTPPALRVGESSSNADSKTISSPESPNLLQGIKYASGMSVITPAVIGTRLHGPSRNVPTRQYLEVETPKTEPLDDELLVPGVNGDISTQYGLSLDTGVLEFNESSEALLAPLKHRPHLSRDGGQGGYLNGQHLFIFSDTGSYSTTTSTTDGKFLGFVSSSVSVDVGMNGLQGKALTLKDGMGQWSDDVGRMRGFAPLTQGEQSYNKAMQGKGQRYAIWPESSIIPLNNESALLYAPIVYTNVNHQTKKAVFTYTGSTLLSVTAGGMGGPVATRTVDKIFEQHELEWGCSGGIRSWGASGIGGTDGKVYVFGNNRGGLLLSRTSASRVADRDSVIRASVRHLRRRLC